MVNDEVYEEGSMANPFNPIHIAHACTVLLCYKHRLLQINIEFYLVQ
jgi:hypothetical protein